MTALDATSITLLGRLKDPADQEAWRTFDRLYRPMLLGYARHRGLGTDDAEDVVQQCIQSVLEKIGEYQHFASFKAWLRTIVDHKIADLFRKRNKELVADTSLWAQQAGKEPDPALAWEREWCMAHLRFCMEAVRGEVAEQTFAAFRAYAVEGCPPVEVAASLGMRVEEVYVAKHRVLARIRRVIRELTGHDASELFV